MNNEWEKDVINTKEIVESFSKLSETEKNNMRLAISKNLEMMTDEISKEHFSVNNRPYKDSFNENFKLDFINEKDISGDKIKLEPDYLVIDSMSQFRTGQLTMKQYKSRKPSSDVKKLFYVNSSSLGGLHEGYKKTKPLNKRKAQRKARRINRNKD